MTFCTELNLKFFRKLIKYFMYFRTKFALFFRFFDSWYIIKYLLTETSGKQYVLWTLDCRCFPRLRLGPQNILFWSQSISVKCIMLFTKFANYPDFKTISKCVKWYSCKKWLEFYSVLERMCKSIVHFMKKSPN